ncbi:MAG: bifunctional phosphoglucose/phosphomannose isomerase [Candidatus Kerfeldbacteria bacterium]|nr:bifunctional phosphoglucose/phosphomannose isomerase [Candidatus Kerfeldbacteria bacterium]
MSEVSYLDLPASIKQVDVTDLASILRQFPEQLEAATKEFSQLQLPADWASCQQVIFCGMGGSAIGAELACDLPAEFIRKPLLVVHDYELPAYADKNSLVVVITYSGATEEALACWQAALKRGCKLLVVTGGQKLADAARAKGVLCYHFNYPTQPRDALGYLFAPLLRVLVQARVITPAQADLTPAIKQLKKLVPQYDLANPTDKNLAKELAYLVLDRVPQIIAGRFLAGVAKRWKNQFNEHSKSAAWFDLLPELDHNTLEGFAWPPRYADDTIIFLLRSSYEHPEVNRRADIFHAWLRAKKILVNQLVPAVGGDWWSEKLSLVLLGDWVSYYLALLHRVDPVAIPNIISLKQQLRHGKTV